MSKITAEELAKHNKPTDCWVSVGGKVINVTKFLSRHPGGEKILLKVAGTDATKHFLKFHPTDVLRMLKPEEILGELAMDTANVPAEEPESSPESKQLVANREAKPSLSSILNVFDFELIARNTMDRVGWYYYSSGADDEITLRENHRAFQRIWFRPKVLVDVKNVDISSKFLGSSVEAPFYITATALARLGHPDGEVTMTHAAAKEGIVQMLSNLASCSVDEVMNAATDKQSVWMQIYVNEDRELTRKFLQHGESLGVKGFFVTVDAPQLGHREKDMRSKYDDDLADVQGESTDADRSQGAARAISSFIDPSLSWKDIPFLKKSTKKPLAIKGIQRWEDAVRAAKAGVNAIVISNHGGRQLEFARSSIEILAEVMPELRKRGLDKKMEVYIDGGIRRGTDVIKALCLGAKGVGIGRPFLYAMSTYGVDGVQHAIRLLKDEIIMNMRLLGANKLSDLTPRMLDTRSLSLHDSLPTDHTMADVYEPLLMPPIKQRL